MACLVPLQPCPLLRQLKKNQSFFYSIKSTDMNKIYFATFYYFLAFNVQNARLIVAENNDAMSSMENDYLSPKSDAFKKR